MKHHIFQTLLNEMKELKEGTEYCSEMAKEAVLCGEKWAAKEYESLIVKYKERIKTLEPHLCNKEIWGELALKPKN